MEGKILKALLKSSGMKQGELAEKLNVSGSSVSKWIAGQRDPDDEIKVQLAKMFNVSVDYLMGLEEKNKIPTTFSMRHNQQEHLRKRECAGVNNRSEVLEGIRPEMINHDIYLLPVYKFSEITTEGDSVKTEKKFPITADDLPFNEKSLFLIRQDIPFKMVSCGPIPAQYSVLANKDFEFKNGYIYLLSYKGICCIKRVTKYPDGNIELTDDLTSKVFSDSSDIKIIAQIIRAIPTDSILLD